MPLYAYQQSDLVSVSGKIQFFITESRVFSVRSRTASKTVFRADLKTTKSPLTFNTLTFIILSFSKLTLVYFDNFTKTFKFFRIRHYIVVSNVTIKLCKFTDSWLRDCHIRLYSLNWNIIH